MEKNYLLSIVIPTRNRQFYCNLVVRQVLSVTSENTQIIVQDNSDTDQLRNELRQFAKEERLIINYNSKRLSFTDNFTEALSFVKGKYVCMIGDDDGVLANIEDVALFAYKTNLDAVLPSLGAVYIWPTEKSFIKNGENGYLVLSHINRKTKKVNCKDELQKLIHTGFQNYQKKGVPRLYHGIVANEYVRQMTGGGINGLTPDMYMTVALSLSIENILSINIPITISGICPKSGSSASATGEHTNRNLYLAPHFFGHENYKWDDNVPEFYSVETIWADTGLHALMDYDSYNFVDTKFREKLYSILWEKYPQFRFEIKKTVKRKGISLSRVIICSYLDKTLKLIHKLMSRIVRRKTDVQKFYGISDIDEAYEITWDMMKKKCIDDIFKYVND